jgi:hypothetical protein
MIMEERSNTKEKILIATGMLFISAGILFNEWLLAAVLSSDGIIATPNRIVIWIVDLCLISTDHNERNRCQTLEFAK